MFKVVSHRRSQYAAIGGADEETLSFNGAEISCCMGGAWRSCAKKEGNTLHLKKTVFYVWYCVVLCLDAGLAALMWAVVSYT